MRSLFRFILKYHFFVLFISLELISLLIAVNSNKIKKSIVLSSANSISGFLYEQIDSYTSYFNLRNENQKLVIEHTLLQNKLKSYFKIDTALFYIVRDTNKYMQKYSFKHARIINNSIHKQKNYLTLNKGKKQGIEQDMVVISPDGVVGIVMSASNNFSVVISLLNSELGISAKIKKNNYYGSVTWNGNDYRYATLNEIPNHVKLEIGDTVITSGYSAAFPEGISIGTIKKYKLKGGDNFYDIRIMLSTDFKKLSNVYVIKNLLKDEQMEIEKKSYFEDK